MPADLVRSIARRAPLLLATFLLACPPAEDPRFTIVLEDLPGGLLSVHGTSATDVWAVGGTAGFAGFVWHLVGGVWTDVPLPAAHPGAAVFKVWGTGPTAVWFCGLEGTLMTLEGGSLSMLTSGTSNPLFTVHASGDDVVAVGGSSNASVLERQPGGRFMDTTPDLAPRMNGVWLTGDGRGWAVGGNGEMLARTAANEWEIFDPGVFVGHDLHAVWVDPSGGVWMVGGDILVEPLVDGILVHRGDAVPSTLTME